MGRQTTVQETNAIRFGSGRFDVDNGGGWVNLGAMRDIEFEETWDKVRVMSDNAGPITLGIRNHQAALRGQMMEINLERLSELRGGLDTYDTVAGTPVVDEDQVILQGSWSFEKFILLDGQMSDGTAPNVTAVVGSTDGALTVVAGDWNLVQNSAGKWGIVIHDDGATTTVETQNITVTSTYTPAAHSTLEAGHNYTINPVAVRVVNTNEAGDEFIIEVFKATTEDGITISLPSDDDEDPAMVPINLMGEVDTAGVTNKLFKIYDYQT